MKVTITCSRCGKQIEGAQDDWFTSGFYPVGPDTAWHRFSNEGETHLCDPCMWADPRYRAVYEERDAAAFNRDRPCVWTGEACQCLPGSVSEAHCLSNIV